MTHVITVVKLKVLVIINLYFDTSSVFLSVNLFIYFILLLDACCESEAICDI